MRKTCLLTKPAQEEDNEFGGGHKTVSGWQLEGWLGRVYAGRCREVTVNLPEGVSLVCPTLNFAQLFFSFSYQDSVETLSKRKIYV